MARDFSPHGRCAGQGWRVPRARCATIGAVIPASRFGRRRLVVEHPSLLVALLLGIVEGLTEFLPISSTGHLIVAGSLLGYTGEQAKVFEIVIQAGAILAVCWEFRTRLAAVVRGLFRDPRANRFVVNLAIAFLPAATLGLLLGRYIKAALFAPVPVAMAFVAGALVILWVERRQRVQPATVRIDDIDAMR